MCFFFSFDRRFSSSTTKPCELKGGKAETQWHWLADCALAPRCTFTRHNDVLCPHRCCVSVNGSLYHSEQHPCFHMAPDSPFPPSLPRAFCVCVCVSHNTERVFFFKNSPPFVSTRNKVPHKSPVPAQTAQRSSPYLFFCCWRGQTCRRSGWRRGKQTPLSEKATPKFDRKVTRSPRCAMQLLEG